MNVIKIIVMKKILMEKLPTIQTLMMKIIAKEKKCIDEGIKISSDNSDESDEE